MRIHKNQLGFSHVEAFILIIVIAVIGFVGYKVYDRQQTMKADNEATQQLEQDAAAIEQTDPDAGNEADAKVLDEQSLDF